MSDPSDPDLVRRCLEGEEGAWRALTERYADFVYGVARRSGLDTDAAGDVVQEVFVALLRSLKRLKQQERLVGWLAQTARREAWKQVRRRRQRGGRERTVARTEALDGPLPMEALGQLEDQQLVRLAYAQLGERCRRLLDRLFVTATESSYQEIAAELGIPIGSIGPNRQRCLESLRKALEELGFEGPARASRARKEKRS